MRVGSHVRACVVDAGIFDLVPIHWRQNALAFVTGGSHVCDGWTLEKLDHPAVRWNTFVAVVAEMFNDV